MRECIIELGKYPAHEKHSLLLEWGYELDHIKYAPTAKTGGYLSKEDRNVEIYPVYFKRGYNVCGGTFRYGNFTLCPMGVKSTSPEELEGFTEEEILHVFKEILKPETIWVDGEESIGNATRDGFNSSRRL